MKNWIYKPWGYFAFCLILFCGSFSAKAALSPASEQKMAQLMEIMVSDNPLPGVLAMLPADEQAIVLEELQAHPDQEEALGDLIKNIRNFFQVLFVNIHPKVLAAKKEFKEKTQHELDLSVFISDNNNNTGRILAKLFRLLALDFFERPKNKVHQLDIPVVANADNSYTITRKSGENVVVDVESEVDTGFRFYSPGIPVPTFDLFNESDPVILTASIAREAEGDVSDVFYDYGDFYGVYGESGMMKKLVRDEIIELIRVEGESFEAAAASCEYLDPFGGTFSNLPNESKDFYTFISPSGRPISLPPDATKLKFSGKLVSLASFNCGNQENLSLPKEVLTGFEWKNELYSAIVKNGYFIGYKVGGSSSSTTYTDAFTLQNLADLSFYIPQLNSNEYEVKKCSFTIESLTEKPDDPYTSVGDYNGVLGLACLGADGYQSAVDLYAQELKRLFNSGREYVSGVYQLGVNSTKKDYDDRFLVFNQTEKKKLFVIQQPINFDFTNENREKFIDDVISNSGIAYKKSEMLLITMPYKSAGNGIIIANSSLLNFRGFKENFELQSTYDSFPEMLDAIYSQIAKTYILFSYHINYDGSIQQFPIQSKTNFVGKSRIYECVITKDERFEAFAALLRRKKSLNESLKQQNADVNRISNELLKIYDHLENFNSFSEDENFTFVGHGLLESALKKQDKGTSQTGLQYVLWYRDYSCKIAGESINAIAPSPVSNSFLFGKNPILYEDNLKGIDALAIVLSPFGLDFVAELAGAVYSGLSGDLDTAKKYTVSTVVAGGVSGTLLFAIIKREKTVGGVVKGVAKGAGKLADNLTGTLKATFDDIVGAGIKYVDDGSSIKFIDNAGGEIATIVNGKFTPSKWTLQRKSKGTLISHTDEGYKLIKNGSDFAFELGYKEGRALSAAEVNMFHKAVGNHEPYKPLTTAIERNLQSGDKIYIVEYANGGVPNPGGWGSKNQINSLKEVREDLAILNDWKDLNKDKLVLREYTVKKPLPVRDGVVGPLQEVTGPNSGAVYYGNQQQYEFMEYLGNNNWESYLNITNRKGVPLE
jgi:hypothetical protein